MSQYPEEITPGNTSRLTETFESQQDEVRIPKKIHIVFAHFNRYHSFNGALLDKAIDTLQADGHTVTVSDLYAMDFKIRNDQYDVKDFNGDLEGFVYPAQIGKAALSDGLTKDIMDEVHKLDAADIIIFQFPMQWYSFPAILKGYFDRVFATNVVYTVGGNEFGVFDMAKRLKGKKAMLSFTTGGAKFWYTNRGLNGDMNVLLFPMHNIFRFVNLQILAPHICYAPGRASPEERATTLRRWGKRLRGLSNERTLKHIPMTAFSDTFQLDLNKLDEVSSAPGVAPHTGFHAGRPIVEPDQILPPKLPSSSKKDSADKNKDKQSVKQNGAA